MITTKELAEAVKAPYSTVMRWIQKGKVPGAKLVEESRGPVWYIPRAAVKRFEPSTRDHPQNGAQPAASQALKRAKKAPAKKARPKKVKR